MADPTAEQTVASLETFRVDPELCIACDACCQDFPEIFSMGDDEKAHEIDGHDSALYNARVVVDTCPTSAIGYSGELPPAEDLAQLEEIDGWEAEWARWRGVEEDRVERDRRYGRDVTIEEFTDHVLVRLHLPTRVPAVRDRFRYGLPELMPAYGSHVYTAGGSLLITAWVTDPKIRALTHTSNSFPGQFTTTVEIPTDLVGFKHRSDAHGLVEIVGFKDEQAMARWNWRSHFITDACTACSICERVCPTNAISGGEERYQIDPDLCINCSVCGVYCPFDAIDDQREVLVEKIKPKKVPKALVHEELCTGCEFCTHVCPFDALVMRPLVDDGALHHPQTSTVAEVIPKNCTSCKLCEQVCIKDAIEVPRTHPFEDIGMSFMSYLTDDH
ncbi:MAG: 4Fe-4S binding protein [Planctomycetota bacterium]|jgi:ferredoxin|nr:4Fe-4S binding protein [Planctomycetota bacterium]MDP6989579.1 4Fe-4S binding protein [Planctomycetota bacterium]